MSLPSSMGLILSPLSVQVSASPPPLPHPCPSCTMLDLACSCFTHFMTIIHGLISYLRHIPPPLPPPPLAPSPRHVSPLFLSAGMSSVSLCVCVRARAYMCVCVRARASVGLSAEHMLRIMRGQLMICNQNLFQGIHCKRKPTSKEESKSVTSNIHVLQDLQTR